MDNAKNRRTIGLCRLIVVVLVIAVVALAIALGIVASKLKDRELEVNGACKKTSNIDLNPPAHLSPFHDLTPTEVSAVRKFLHQQESLNLVPPSKIAVNSSYVFSFELHVPNKQETLAYLDDGRPQPAREAHVVIFRGDLSPPASEEYTVGPLPNPTYLKDKKSFPFRYRPLTTPEIVAAITLLYNEISSKANFMLLECYGGKLVDCTDNCLDFEMLTPQSGASVGDPSRRKMWFWLSPAVEFWSLNPLDFRVLVDMTSTDPSEFRIDTIYHANRPFTSVDQLVRDYNDNRFPKTRMNYPKVDNNLFSSIHRRGTLHPMEPMSPPLQYEPDGKRYSIKGRHIDYMGWAMDVRMSTQSGPQVWDVRFNGERIVYELSLQDIAVFYSAHSPSMRFADYVDSVAQIGYRARTLVPGADCPPHATFLSVDHVVEGQEEPMRVEHGMCVFEHDTGVPLWRHHTRSGNNKFYAGLPDVVLIVRTIATVVNYDYIFDFIFHQNGAVEVRGISTGYILAAFRYPEAQPFGFEIRKHMTGNIHHHMFNFKVDMDINGRTNRFETITIRPVNSDNTRWSTQPGATYSQTEMHREVIQNETHATVDYNFDTPRYLTFYNKDFTTDTGIPRAYRLLMRGMSKQLVAKGSGQEPSVSWARHQLAVTKYRESERRSSSLYACLDGANPVVNFNSFIADDDNITDVDQVAWVTMGVHHIPHTEDMPVTPTSGLDLRFLLLPYNYFREEPSLGSGDAVRVQPRNQKDLTEGVKLELYGRSTNPQCVPDTGAAYRDVESNAEIVFDPPSGIAI